jgi:hypothetical protein
MAVILPADLIRLQNGGELRGTLHAGHTRDPRVTIDTLSGGEVVVDRRQVALSTVRRIEIEQYEVRSRSVANTVDARWELAEWCRENRLTNQRNEQLELLLELDPEHADARQALGHVRERGEWMTRAEMMAARGYFLHQGKWVTQQELDLLAKTSAQRAAEREWFSRVHVLVAWITGTRDRQRDDGVAQLKAIHDPAAVPALTKNMSTHQAAAVRRLFVDIVSQIPGPAPVQPLVDRSLHDPELAIRQTAFAGLGPSREETAVAAYTSALLNRENVVVNRAGTALGKLGDVRCVPALIDALVTRHTYEIQVPVNDLPGTTVGPNGTLFADPRVIAQYLPPDIDLALRAGQLPFGVKIDTPMDPKPRFRQVRIQVQQQNDSVLTALQELTGQNFGYDERTWGLWWAAEGTKLQSKS